MKSLFTIIISGLFIFSANSQTQLIELDESLGDAKSIVRTVSSPDGKTIVKEYKSADEAKFAYMDAIEKRNLIMLQVEYHDIFQFEKNGVTYIRYAALLKVDQSAEMPAMGPEGMPGGDPNGMPGMEPGGMPGQMPADDEGPK